MQRNAFERHPSAACGCENATLVSHTFLLTHCAFLSCSSLQAAPLLLDRVQSRTGPQDSHRYPELTRCHCEAPVITISSAHETFMAGWQWMSGKNPHFQRKTWQNPLFWWHQQNFWSNLTLICADHINCTFSCIDLCFPTATDCTDSLVVHWPTDRTNNPVSFSYVSSV